jgi:DNA helicase-2/ATP-dependent DNA helicase PcrA
MEGERLGFSRQFTIYDAEDQIGLIRQILAELTIPLDKVPPAYIHHRISHVKNSFENIQNFVANSFKDEMIAKVYPIYQQRLRESNAMDFDDLLLFPLELFQRHPDILAKYDYRFRHILVDEFQDTNRAQYIFLRALTSRNQNVFAVGDDDQSIYRWRGADLRNILEFEADYPGCKVFRLEQNYRSTRNILSAANSVIARNRDRLPKALWTEREEGEKVILLEAGNEFHEAQIILDKISEEIGSHSGSSTSNRSFRDFAILYRTNAQSRIIEDTLRRAGIPYVIVGGLRFYERREVKDVLAYMRLAANPADHVSLRRIINYPLRGIGETTIKKLEEFARVNGLTLFAALGRAGEIATITARLREKVLEFHHFITRYINLKNQLSLVEWVNALIDATGIIQWLKSEGAQERVDNIRELLKSIYEFAGQASGATIEDYLERVSLVTDIDNWNDKANAVTLMTLHSAKGLEFPIVFIIGLEEGLFPLIRSDDIGSDIEEERRLFYVGTTRAKEKLFLSYAVVRNRFGNASTGTSSQTSLPSRFLKELDDQFVRQESVRRPRLWEACDSHTGEFEESRLLRYRRDNVMPDYENESQEAGEIRAGQMVRHPQFGLGEILAVDGKGENLKITIRFEDEEIGVKKIMVMYANLEFL